MAEIRKVPLLLVGTYHMNNPGRDLNNVVADDVLSAVRQAEMEAAVASLGRFRPTLVALEVRREEDDALNLEYRHYQQGRLTLTTDERHQLGFRLAARVGLERIHAVDWNEMPPYVERDLGDIWKYAETQDPALHTALSAVFERWASEFSQRQATDTISELLRWLNDPEGLAADHQNYLTLAQLGTGGEYPAVPWITAWLERNLTIFVNLTRLLGRPDDRLLVIYGRGHIPLLSQFAAGSGLFSLESPGDYLP